MVSKKEEKQIHDEILNDTKSELNREADRNRKHHDHMGHRHDKDSPRHHDNQVHHEHHSYHPGEEDGKIKKGIIVGFGALLMIFLMLSFAFVTYPISDIILSEQVASDASSNILKFGEYTVVFDESTFTELQDYYQKESEIEFVICMKGFADDKNYFIDSFYEPVIYSRSFSRVSFEGCDSESLILLHSHPHKHCVASNQDIETLNNMKENNEDVLMMIMCESDSISVYK